MPRSAAMTSAVRTPAAASAELVPRRAALAVLGGTALLVAGLGSLRLGGYRPTSADGPPRAARALRFVDRADGGIDVLDAASGRVIDRAHGEQGFLRGTLRGLARERRRRRLGSDMPLQLQRRADDRLQLLDPATGERIDLDAFGPDNAAVFARWLGPLTPPKETP
jgi:putative photosynthetic complex assembly protein